MKTNVTKYDFIDSFEKMGRGDNFSYDGLASLYEYFIDYEDSCDTEIEFDVIGICCEYTEYADIEEFHGNYDKEDYPDIETIEEHTQVIKINEESFIIVDF